MPKSKKDDSTSDSDSGPDDRKPSPPKKSKSSASSKAENEGTSGPWTLEKLRRVSINEFRGRKSVDIREHYEKDGKVLPGKKGISLTPTQWKKLLEIADEVTAAMKD